MSTNERFEALYRHFRKLVDGLAKRTRSTPDAEDLVQDAMVATWRRLDKVDPASEIGYVWRAANNRATNHDQRVRKGEPLDDLPAPTDPSASPEELAMLDDEIARALRALPDETRLTFVLSRRAVSDEDIARRLGVRPATVRSRVSRAWQQILEAYRNDHHA
jgi:RNA polymerase sigma-70 factor, ECF subfamily